MIISQNHKTPQIFQFAADILTGMVPSGVIVIDPTRQPILTLSPTDRSIGQVKVPCHLIIDYRDTRPPAPVETCCVCESEIVGPVAFRRFGKFPACSEAHADAAPVEVIRGTPRAEPCEGGAPPPPPPTRNTLVSLGDMPREP